MLPRFYSYIMSRRASLWDVFCWKYGDIESSLNKYICFENYRGPYLNGPWCFQNSRSTFVLNWNKTALKYSPGDSGTAQLCKLMTAGGTAGVLSWIISYPLDVIKSRIQAQKMTKNYYRGVLDCLKKTLLKDGRRKFWSFSIKFFL